MGIVPRREIDASRNLVLEEIGPPPTDVPPPPLTRGDVQTQAALLVVVIANIAMSAIIMGVIWRGEGHVAAAILCGTLYFLLSTVIFTFVITGSLSTIVGHLAHEQTERRRVDVYGDLGAAIVEYRLLQEHNRAAELLARRPPTEGVQRISPLNTYVAPYADPSATLRASGEEAVRHEALRWLAALYGEDGHPDRKQVHGDGRLRRRMIGSKRGEGSRDAGIWLLRVGAIRRVQGGYALNVSDFPHRGTLRRLIA